MLNFLYSVAKSARVHSFFAPSALLSSVLPSSPSFLVSSSGESLFSCQKKKFFLYFNLSWHLLTTTLVVVREPCWRLQTSGHKFDFRSEFIFVFMQIFISRLGVSTCESPYHILKNMLSCKVPVVNIDMW